jgi:hypothetical protein
MMRSIAVGWKHSPSEPSANYSFDKLTSFAAIGLL